METLQAAVANSARDVLIKVAIRFAEGKNKSKMY